MQSAQLPELFALESNPSATYCAVGCPHTKARRLIPQVLPLELEQCEKRTPS